MLNYRLLGNSLRGQAAKASQGYLVAVSSLFIWHVERDHQIEAPSEAWTAAPLQRGPFPSLFFYILYSDGQNPQDKIPRFALPVPQLGI